eukprot:1541137-Amphidinium_carterae.1
MTTAINDHNEHLTMTTMWARRAKAHMRVELSPRHPPWEQRRLANLLSKAPGSLAPERLSVWQEGHDKVVRFSL